MRYKEEDKDQVIKASYYDSNPATRIFSGGYIEEILDNRAPTDIITLMKYAIENNRMITVRFTGDSKYTENAILPMRLNRLTNFFDSINTY